MRRIVSVLIQCLVVSAFLTPDTLHLTPGAEAARIEEHDGLRVVHLSGTPYEIGQQHGELLHEEVRESVSTILGYFRRYLRIPLIGGVLASWWLGRAWWQAKPFVPEAYLEELRGLSDGSGVPLRDLYQLHAIPDRTYSCSSFAAWGPATAGHRLIHTRNLDWNIEVGLQRFATVFVIRSEGKQAFINLGWAGFVGVLSGVNEEGISIGQIGAETTDATYRGLPMVFLMRRVMEEADDLQTAIQVIREAPRTVGINYVVADARAQRAVAMETTRRHTTVFHADDPKERGISYARPMAHAVFRADTAMDPAIRDLQVASNGDPVRAGLEDPAGSSAYDVRYLGQAKGLAASRGTLDLSRTLDIVRSVAPGSNVQSVVFAWPEVWVANADGLTRAAHTRYHRLDAARLLQTTP